MNGERLWVKAAGVAAAAAMVSLVIVGCSKPKHPSGDWSDKPGPKVVVSFAPLYCFAANVAGDDAQVKNVMTTIGPHDFNPTADDIRLVTKADLFFTIGLGLDEEKAKVMKKGSSNDKLKLVELSARIPKDKLYEGKCDHGDHDPGHEHTHPLDPHVWLSPDHAILLVNGIRDELKDADPANAAGYEQRAADYVAKLNALKAYGLDKLKGIDKEKRKLVSFHDSLAYFERAFDLKVEGVLTKKAGQEPDKAQMEKLIATCTDKKVRLIAVEPQYSTSNSGETLRKELVNKGVTDAALVELDPLETVRPDELTKDWYERKMRENLDALAKAMK